MSNKSYGLTKEREGRKLLESKGFTVIPAKGSLGCFDAIAFKEEIVKLIQFKSTKQKYYSYPKEIEEISNFHNHPKDWKKELWIYLSPRRDRKEKGWKIIEIKD